MVAPFTIVTAANAKYFDLLRGLIGSIRDKREGQLQRIAVLDLGLTGAQLSWLADRRVMTVRPNWDPPELAAMGFPEHFKALTARPHLPRYFPGAEVIVWLDSDTWVQDWQGIDLLVGAAGADDQGAIACVPEIDRAYRNFFHAWEEFHEVHLKVYRAAFGEELAVEMVRYPLINSGVFALRRQSPVWAQWARRVAQALSASGDFLVEQAALNVAVYKDGAAHHFLPSWCNWAIHHATPAYDTVRGCFVEPNLPHQKLAILHMTIYTKHAATIDVRQLGGRHHGKLMPISPRYPGSADALSSG